MSTPRSLVEQRQQEEMSAYYVARSPSAVAATQTAATPFDQESVRPSGFAEWFAVSQTLLPALLLLPGSQMYRLPLRVGAYAISLYAFALWWLDAARVVDVLRRGQSDVGRRHVRRAGRPSDHASTRPVRHAGRGVRRRHDRRDVRAHLRARTDSVVEAAHRVRDGRGRHRRNLSEPRARGAGRHRRDDAVLPRAA